MVYKRFYAVITGYVVLILVASLGFSFFLGRINLYALLCLIFLFTISVSFVKWLNLTNEKLSFFFSAIKNDDGTFHFPERGILPGEIELNKSLNYLNEKLKEARINIEIQEKFYQSIMDNIRTGIISFTVEGVVEYANPEFSRMFLIENISHINRLSSIDPKLTALLKEIKPAERKWINVKAGQNLLSLAVISQEIMLRGRILKIVSFQNIKNELDKQELESWQKLIRILNHEIMNSVTPITSLSSTLLGMYQDTNGKILPEAPDSSTVADTVRGLNIIGEHGKGLIRFVESYRTLTRLPDPDFSVITLSGFFESISILANSQFESEFSEAGRRPLLKTILKPEDLTLVADEKLLTRVMLNLIRNSAEAFKNSEGNIIEISGSLSSEGRVIITVMDNGPGIEKEIADKLFIPFFTTKENGSGIGLSLSRQIMSLHNGSINCDSEPGKWTRFTLEF